MKLRAGDIVRTTGESGHLALCKILWFEGQNVVVTRQSSDGFRPTKHWFGTPVRNRKDVQFVRRQKS